MFTRIDASTIRISAHTCAAVAWPDEPATAAQWRQWIEDVWKLPSTVAAVSVASPVLADRIEAALEAAASWPAADLRRLAYSLGKYLVRMRGRATPFGLFAGTAPLGFGSDVRTRVGADHQTRTRPDTAWISAVIAGLEASPAVRARLAVTGNDLSMVQADRLMVTWQPHAHTVHHAGAKAHEDTSKPRTLRLGPVVRAILGTASSPIAVHSLIDVVVAAFPERSSEYVDLVIARLIDAGALITCLRPTGTTPDVLDHVLTELDRTRSADLPEVAPLVDRLRRVQQFMREADRQPWASQDVRRQLKAEMLYVSTVAPQPTVVDLRHDSSITLPASVADEAATAAQVLQRLGPHRNVHWHAYRMAFVARYGHGAVVPVSELTDPTIGLGFPAHFVEKASAGPLTPRDILLLRLAHQAAVNSQRELLLDDRFLDQIEATEADSRRPASNVDICVDVRATTVADLAAGRFLLGVKGIGRSVVATTGRFLEMFDEADQQRMLTAYRSVPPCTTGGIVAALSSPPSNPSLENVVHTLPAVEHLITLGEHRPATPEHLYLGDLAVTADGDRFYLLSLSRRCTVQPLMGNAAARHTMPMVARFLSEITRAADSPLTLFSWGSAAQHLSTLPRVRYRRTVLSPARWTVDRSLATGSDVDSWTGRFDVLRRKLGVPASVQVGTGDQVLNLNLDDACDRALLHHYAARKPTITLTEAPSPEDYGWLGGRAHEVVIPLITTAKPGPIPRVLAANAPLPMVSSRAAALPGGGVLFAKLYGHPDLSNTILIDHLPALLSRWNGPLLHWWVRFRDPSEHLRLRLHTGDYGQAATRVGSWAAELRDRGLITSLVLDTYHPETARYGAAAIMQAAEELFAADSTAAAAQLRALRSQRSWLAEALTAASLVDLACGVLGGHPAGMRWLVDHPEEPPSGAKRERLDPELVQQTTAFALPSTVPAELADAWRHRRQAAAAYARLLAEPATHLQPDSVVGSLLHMHHIRAQGIDPERESLTYRLARAVALAVHARTGGGQ